MCKSALCSIYTVIPFIRSDLTQASRPFEAAHMSGVSPWSVCKVAIWKWAIIHGITGEAFCDDEHTVHGNCVKRI